MLQKLHVQVYVLCVPQSARRNYEITIKLVIHVIVPYVYLPKY